MQLPASASEENWTYLVSQKLPVAKRLAIIVDSDGAALDLSKLRANFFQLSIRHV